MDELLDLADVNAVLAHAREWFYLNVLVTANLVQLLVIALLGFLSSRAAPALKAFLERLTLRPTMTEGMRRVLGVGASIALPLAWLLLQWVAVLIAEHQLWPHQLLTVTVSLLSAWVVIRLASSFVKDPVWAKFISLTAWTVAALNILDLLESTVELLNNLAFKFGDLRISALLIIKAFISLAVLLWLATFLSRIFEQRIKHSPNLTPSVQVLFSKLLKITLITIAFVAALTSVGIDLTAFAVLGGAIGVGIGFGLQKIVSNLVSGVILLLDKSIKPGDVISVGDYYGWVNSLGARYVSVITRDGTEHLIPNEELITQRVENWSYSDSFIRLRIPVGVHYKSDVRLAIELCLQAARETERVLDEPRTVCLLRGFGDSSVDLEIRIWIKDPQNGRANVTSDVLLKVWDKFHANNIEIPYPQRDLHIRTPEHAAAAIPVRWSGGAGDPSMA